MNLGDRVKDKISGFEGIVIARALYLHGDPKCLVASDSLTSEGFFREDVWLSEARLEAKGFEGIPGFTIVRAGTL